MMLVQVLVMHLMRPANRPHIGMIAPREPFETLMNDDIMYHKVGKPVPHDPKPDRLQPPDMIIRTKVYKQETGNGKNESKQVILFKNARSHLVMVLMEDP